MNCVSLVFTVHEEQGLASVGELHAILLRINPDVIFLEVPAAAFADFYMGRERANLESNAVTWYVESHPQTKLIPIDLPTPEREFFEDFEYLRMRVRETSPKYRQLASLDRDRFRAYGFAYLNSEYCSEHWCNVHAEMLDAIGKLGDHRLSEIQQTWDKANELRELEMMRNIGTYCAVNTFEAGVVLVGAAHRRRLVEQAARQSEFSWAVLASGGDA